LITVSIGIALPAVNPNPRKSLEKPEIACFTRNFIMQPMPDAGKESNIIQVNPAFLGTRPGFDKALDYHPLGNLWPLYTIFLTLYSLITRKEHLPGSRSK